MSTTNRDTSAPLPQRREGGPWGHVLVSASACVLTVSILGSAVFLTHKLYGQYETRGKVREFIASLDNRTPEELAERAAQLKSRPKLAAHLLPEIATALRESRSEQQLRAVIQLAEAFLDHRRIRAALIELRADRREIIAAAAVRALTKVKPPEAAAGILSGFIEEAGSGTIGPAALDEAIAGLFNLGKPGLVESQKRLASLSVPRRIWVAGYVNAAGGPHRAAWLQLLQADADGLVREAAGRAISATAPDGVAGVSGSKG